MKIVTFDDSTAFVSYLCDAVLNVYEKTANVVQLGVSGGLTPLPFYRALAMRTDVDFSRMELYEIDERYVPHTDSVSNFTMIQESLVAPLGDKLGGFFSFDTNVPIDESLHRYERILNKKIEHGFDICFLGVGLDGHIASLFPHCKALYEEKKLVMHTQTDVFEIRDRLTITFPIIMKSKKLIVLLQGEKKQRVVDELQKGTANFDDFPAIKLLEHTDLTIVFLNTYVS